MGFSLAGPYDFIAHKGVPQGWNSIPMCLRHDTLASFPVTQRTTFERPDDIFGAPRNLEVDLAVSGNIAPALSYVYHVLIRAYVIALESVTLTTVWFCDHW